MTKIITSREIDQMPKMDFTFDQEMLKKYQPERLSEEARKGCDSPNTPTKGSEPGRND